METKKLIYQMLTESTGIHFLDSGGDNNRHWQRNQKKTIEDFENEKAVEIFKDGDYYERYVSLFHFLSELKLDETCDKFNKLNDKYDDDKGEIFYRVCLEAELFLLDNFIEVDEKHEFNSYNYDCDLSQTIQGKYILLDGVEYILLQIHNGADVRGGYTKAKLFKTNQYGMINEYIPEFLYQEEIEQFELN